MEGVKLERTAEKLEIIKMDNIISPRLGFRDSASMLFNQLRELESDIVKLDFMGVKFMSRSFAHEYLKQKSKLGDKEIVEANLPDYVNNMFNAVTESIRNPQKLKIKPSKVISLA